MRVVPFLHCHSLRSFSSVVPFGAAKWVQLSRPKTHESQRPSYNTDTPSHIIVPMSVSEVKAPEPPKLKESNDSQIAKKQDITHSMEKPSIIACRRMVELVLEHPEKPLKMLYQHPEIFKTTVDAICKDPEARKVYQIVHR